MSEILQERENAILSTRHNWYQKPLFVFAAGGILGALIFLLLFGGGILDPTYVARMLNRYGVEDLPQHYLAWEYFRRSAWSFPLGNIENLVYPDTISVVYTDSIPLLAVLFKCFSSVLPAEFQYFGIWTLLCFILQGGFGTLLINRHSRSLPFSLLFSLFFVLSPIMILRTFYHSALAGHWILLAAFCIWLYSDQFRSRRTPFLLFSSLSVLAVLIEAYFVPMVLGIYIGYLLSRLRVGQKLRVLTAELAATLCFVGLAAFVFGYFSDQLAPAMYGLGDYSFNLNGFINSIGVAKFIPSFLLSQPGQYEGFSYLGLGGLSLVILALVFFGLRVYREGRAVFYEKMSRALPVVLILIIFMLLAIGPVYTVGDVYLFSLPLPQGALTALSVFRSSGRFVWPVYYAIFLWAGYEFSYRFRARRSAADTDAKATRKEKTKRGLLLLSVALLLTVQVADLSPLLIAKHRLIAREVSYTSVFQDPVWDQLLTTHPYAYIYAPISDLYTDYTPQSFSLELEKLVLDHHGKMNAAFLSRNNAERKDREIAAHFADLAAGKKYPGYIYFFPNPDNCPGNGYNLHYYRIDGILIGLADLLPGYAECFADSDPEAG